MLTIDNLTYRAGPRTLLENTSAMIPPGHRIGLVGRNGSGKTTLLRLITGTLDPDGGSISFPSQWRVGITSQEAPGGNESLIETVLAADTELTDLLAEAENVTDPNRIADVHLRLDEKNAQAAPSRAAKLLAGLGFSEAEQQRPCNEFSGGWRMRVALAALLFTEPDLLLLDEPTNHLDLEATLWLEGYLKRYPGTILLVSHDRDILNRAVDQILHLENNTLTLYSGNYDWFENTRKARLDQIERARGKQQAERERISKFVERFRYKASKARQAQSRLKMLERMEPIADYNQEGVVSFAFPDPDPPPPPLFNARDVAIGYDGTPVLRDITLRLDPDDRIALIGANGNGKSTLIKLLAGRLDPLEGEIGKARRIRVGYFAQHQSEELDMDATPLIQLARRRPSETEQKLRNHLGRFGFTQERSKTRIRNMSGGEKARLLFALMSGDAPHILLLDEPTNHLDIQSREALVQAINAFEGAVVIVSHDPHVVALTTDRLWLVADGTVTQFDGDLDDYRATVLEQSRGNGQGAKKQAAKRDRREERRAAAERRKQVAPLRKQLNRAEKAVERLEVKKSDIQAEMGKPETYNDNDLLLTLQKDLGWAQKELETAETTWLDLHEKLEAAQAKDA